MAGTLLCVAVYPTTANLTFALRGRFPRAPKRKCMACNVSFLKTAE